MKEYAETLKAKDKKKEENDAPELVEDFESVSKENKN